MIERKSILMAAALAAFALVSVPSVLFNNAIKKYFFFVGHWNTAIIKPSRTSAIPPARTRADRRVEAPQPELRFVKFSVKVAGVSEVKIAGDFNKWNPEALVLTRQGKDRWEALIPLPPGKYRYICRIDGQDVLDPLNPDTDLEAGRKVSVLTVK
ncbi:MAG: glycogen-binding domain-containing protein [Elusimicrobiales bacterium]|nr:glycogen-binding domain-containing protein [Elusimicrobiales bacterium]